MRNREYTRTKCGRCGDMIDREKCVNGAYGYTALCDRCHTALDG